METTVTTAPKSAIAAALAFVATSFIAISLNLMVSTLGAHASLGGAL